MSIIKKNSFEPPAIDETIYFTKRIKGFYPWIIILVCALFLLYKFILQTSPSVMANQFMQDFHLNGTKLGNLAAMYFYAYLIMQLFAGPILDRYSPRKVTSFAIAICALSTILFTRAQSLLAAEIARALMGAGAAFATISYLKMSSLWFRPHQVALVDGLLASAAMIGALCSQAPLAFSISHFGWRTSLFYCGLFGCLLSLLFLFLVREKKSIKELDKTKSNLIVDFYILLKNKKNWLLTLYSGCAFTPLAVLGGLWGNPFFEATYHLSTVQASSFTSIMFLGLAFGGPFFGYFAKTESSLKTMAIGTVLSLLTVLPALYLNLPLPLLGLFLFLFGLGTGSFMACYGLGKNLNSIKLAGTVVALINTGDALLGSLTEPLIGKILDSQGTEVILNNVPTFSPLDYRIAFIFLPLYLIIALLCLFFLKSNTQELT